MRASPVLWAFGNLPRALGSLLLVGSLMLTATTSAAADAAAAVDKDFSKALAGEYLLDRAHASVVWRVMHMGLSRYTGRFDKMDGKLDFRPGSPSSSSVEFTIDTASINTGIAPFNRHLMDVEWFDGNKHPSILFQSTKMQELSAGRYRLDGNLTLRGVTKPASWEVTFNGGLYNSFAQAHAVGFSAKTNLKRTDWGLTKLLPVVGDDVEVWVEVEFLHRPAAN